MHRSPWPAVAGAVVLIASFGVAAKLLTSWSPPPPPEDAARAAERAKAYEDLRVENATRLETYAWADRAKGTVQIPIRRAMELTLAELAARPPAPAGPIATPTPASPAPAGSPAARPSPSP